MTRNTKLLFLILGSIQAFVALGALPVGALFIIKPDGSAVGMSVSTLSNSPFNDFLIPGIALFFFNGIFHFTNAILSFLKHTKAPFIGTVLGAGLIIWIIVQIYAIGFNNFLQPMFFIIGCVELILSIILIKNTKI
jgi:hypothetical protein